MILQIHEEIRTTLGPDSVFSGFPLSIAHFLRFPGNVFIQILDINRKNGLLYFQNITKVNNLQITSKVFYYKR